MNSKNKKDLKHVFKMFTDKEVNDNIRGESKNKKEVTKEEKSKGLGGR